MKRFSSRRDPQPLQNLARRWFFSPHRWQWSQSLRDGIARNSPSGPSISFTSRITKVLSNVSEQNAFSRLVCPPHRLMRTSDRCMTHPALRRKKRCELLRHSPRIELPVEHARFEVKWARARVTGQVLLKDVMQL